jgi:acetyl-CoA carboxylase biotin carboxylase subunit
LITTAQSRAEAISKMRRALDEFVIEGIKTTIPFHRLMDDPRYIAGDYAFMDTLRWMTYKVLLFTLKLAVKRVLM